MITALPGGSLATERLPVWSGAASGASQPTRCGRNSWRSRRSRRSAACCLNRVEPPSEWRPSARFNVSGVVPRTALSMRTSAPGDPFRRSARPLLARAREASTLPRLPQRTSARDAARTSSDLHLDRVKDGLLHLAPAQRKPRWDRPPLSRWRIRSVASSCCRRRPGLARNEATVFALL